MSLRTLALYNMTVIVSSIKMSKYNKNLLCARTAKRVIGRKSLILNAIEGLRLLTVIDSMKLFWQFNNNDSFVCRHKI